MADITEVWLLAATPGGQAFPNLHVVGVFRTRQQALETLSRIPREHPFILYRAPLDQFFGYIDKSQRLRDGMGVLHHEHFLPEDDVPAARPDAD